MYGINEVNDYIDAILLNNPTAVAMKMTELGVLQEAYYSPDELKNFLVSALESDPEYGASILIHVLDVPVDINGYAADELMHLHLERGNYNMIYNLVANDTESPVKKDRVVSIDGDNLYLRMHKIDLLLGIAALVLLLLLGFLFKRQ